MRAVVGGLIGGAMGAAVWAAVVLFSGYEYGWIAWGIGGLVGFGVAVGDRDGGRSPTAAGVIAVAIAAVSILAGKYVGIELTMPSDQELLSIFAERFEDEEFVVSYLADDIVVEFEQAGRAIVWPTDVEPEFASMQSDYPTDVWTEASSRWGAMTPADRRQFTDELAGESRAEMEASLPEIRAAIAGGGFVGSFSPMDIIFFGLAMTTAFGLASGRKKSAEEGAAEYTDAVQLAMIEVMIADGEVDDEEVRTLVEIYREMTGLELSDDVVRAKATLANSTGKDLNAALTELAPHLNEEGKASVLQAAVRIAIADGEFEASEQAVLSQIGRALELSDEQMRETVHSLTQAAGTTFT